MKNDVKSSVQELYQSVKGSTAAPSGNEDNSVDIRMASKAQNIVNEVSIIKFLRAVAYSIHLRFQPYLSENLSV